MIKSVSINNFRCFRKVSIAGLSRVNVIVGANGSGKTSLLEAIFLAFGRSPELAWRLRNFRGMGTTLELNDQAALESAWKDLFNNFDQRKSITIQIDASDAQSQFLEISIKGMEQQIRIPIRSRQQTSALTSNVEFFWRDELGEEFRSRPTIVGDKLQFPQTKTQNRVVFLPANFRMNPEENARRLSNLSRVDEAKDLVEVLSIVYPDLKDLSVENSDGSWEVFARLDRLGERLPMALYSSGANRLLSIVLAIASTKRGTVLIDEMENGFFFETLPGIWKLLHEVADSYHCQLFVSTHSRECLKALGPVAEENSKRFALINAVTDKSGSSRLTVSTGEEMAAAIQSGFEVRIQGDSDQRAH